MNFSKNLMVAWLTPIRTGTRSCMRIMDYFNFDRREDHECFIEGNLNDYFFIVNTHNPYKRLFSIYNFDITNSNTKLDFKTWSKKYISQITHNNNPQQIIITEILKNLSKKPDYIVKVESLYDDLMNLDFIKNDKSDSLEEIFKNYILTNRTFDPTLPFWKTEYDEKFADYVYENLKKDFDFFDYKKDSWK
mgnify:CR=1 FL=1